MSVRSGNNIYGNSRSTRVDDYYSDEEDEHVQLSHRNTPISSYSSNSPRHSPNHFHAYNTKRNNMMNRNSNLRNNVHYYQPEEDLHDQSRYGYPEEDEEEEDLRRAIHDFGLEDHMYNNRIPLPPPRRRSSFEYEMENRMMYSPHQSPGYFLPPPAPPPSRFDEDLHYHHFMGGDSRYGPPPPMHHPPPPPHWLPPPPHPSQEFGPPQNDMIMYSPQHQPMDPPFVRRSASSRSYNRRNRPNHRSIRRNPEALFLSRDDNEEPLLAAEHDVNNNFHRFRQPHPSMLRPPLSRQSSVGSNSSRKSHNNPHQQFRKKRANSFSAPGTAYPPPPPHVFMQPPPHDFYGPRIRSEPNSPRLSLEDSSSSGDEDSMDEYYGRHGARRNSMPAVGARRPLGRSLSFQGMPPPHPAMVPPPPPPPQPQQQGPAPPLIIHPPHMPVPNVMDNTLRRNSSMFNLATNPPAANPGGSDFFVDPNNPQALPQQQQPQLQPQEHTNGSTTPASTSDIPPPLPMWMAMPPQPPQNSMGAFPASPGANIGNPFNQQQQQQQQAAVAAAQMMMAGGGPMGMFNNPLMPPQQPMWNFMNPQDLFFGNDMPLPFMNSSDPNVIVNAMGAPVPPSQQVPKPQGSPGGESSGAGGNGPAENDKMRSNRPEEGGGGPGEMMPPPPNGMMMPPPPPPQEPMLRRGLSMLGGLFGGNGGGGRKNGPPYFGGPPPPPHFGGNVEDFGPRGGGGFGNFRPPIQGGGYQSKKEAKLAQQYQKLGLIWCWRIMNSEDNRFESFNISNQKLIKRKAEKPETLNGEGIMLGKEKKLPGEIMIDITRGRGCAVNTVNGVQQFTQIEIKQEPFEGSSIVFNGGGGGWM